MKFTKKCLIAFVLSIVIALSFAACKGNSSMSDTFPTIKSADIPGILEKSVGTVGDTYFTSWDSSGDNDYNAYFKVVFEDTDEADYNELVEHYQPTSIGNIKDDRLLFDWGSLKMFFDNHSITVEAYIN